MRNTAYTRHHNMFTMDDIDRPMTKRSRRRRLLSLPTAAVTLSNIVCCALAVSSANAFLAPCSTRTPTNHLSNFDGERQYFDAGSSTRATSTRLRVAASTMSVYSKPKEGIGSPTTKKRLKRRATKSRQRDEFVLSSELVSSWSERGHAGSAARIVQADGLVTINKQATRAATRDPVASTKTDAAKAKARKAAARTGKVYASQSLVRSAEEMLLTPEEEIQFTQNVRTLQAAVRIRDELAAKSTIDASDLETKSFTNMMSQFYDDVVHLPSDHEWAEACGTSLKQLRRVIHEGQKARSRLVSANVGLVTAIAKRQFYSLKQATEAGNGVGTILTLQDMIQEGNLGLIEAAERFDTKRGVRFSTYATWWVRQRILRSISDSSRIIRLPAHVHSMLTKINRARREIREGGREPSIPELARYLQISEEKLRMYTESSRNVVSLELPLRTNAGTFKEDSRTLGDSIASDAPTPEEDAQVDSLRRDIRAVIDELEDVKERDVVVARFGLDDGKPRTVAETAKSLGLSRDRVRMVEARALNKLRHPQRNYRLKEYVGASSSRQQQQQQHHQQQTQQQHQQPYTLHQGENQNSIHEFSPEKLWFF